MIEDIGGVTSRLVTLALDVASQRQQVIAHNIANANTPGYIPQRVSFEQWLDLAAVSDPDRYDKTGLLQNLDDLQQRLRQGELIEETGDEAVALDMEMVKLTENVLRYRALLEGLAKRGSLVKMAISEGR
jgi:flagellar basal-body rod protein FlgB